MSKLYYLASPFSHPNPFIRFKRFWQITKLAALLMKRDKLNLITPISSSFVIGIVGNIHGDFDTWKELDLECVRRSDGVIVALMEGWDKSKGVLAEIAHAKAFKKPIIYMTLDGRHYKSLVR